MVDGDFMRENYHNRAVERGDAFFGMCLFNPQRDVYTFQKHYRENASVITAPLGLHQKYHNNGFPWVTLFKNGREVASYPFNRSTAFFEDMPFARYVLVFTRKGLKAGEYPFEIKETRHGREQEK